MSADPKPTTGAPARTPGAPTVRPEARSGGYAGSGFKSNPYEIAYEDVEHAIAEFQAGFAVSIPLGDLWRVGTGWIYSGRTAEFEGVLARTHTYGSAFFSITKTPDLGS